MYLIRGFVVINVFFLSECAVSSSGWKKEWLFAETTPVAPSKFHRSCVCYCDTTIRKALHFPIWTKFTSELGSTSQFGNTNTNHCSTVDYTSRYKR